MQCKARQDKNYDAVVERDRTRKETQETVQKEMRNHTEFTKEVREKEAKAKQKEESAFVDRIKQEISDEQKAAIKKKKDYQNRMDALHSHAETQKAEKIAQGEKEKQNDIVLGKQYAEQLEKAERDRKTALQKLTSYVSRSNPDYVLNVQSKAENARKEQEQRVSDYIEKREKELKAKEIAQTERLSRLNSQIQCTLDMQTTEKRKRK